MKGYGSDSSIIIDAMSDYISFSKTQPGMPFLACEENHLYLIEGLRLIKSMRKANYNKSVMCIWSFIKNCIIPSGAVPFNLEFTNSIGEDYRVITCKEEISKKTLKIFEDFFGCTPTLIGNHSIGWNPESSSSLGDFSRWRTNVEEFSIKKIDVIAINGRQFIDYPL